MLKVPARPCSPNVNEVAKTLVSITGNDEAAREAAAESILDAMKTSSSPPQNLPSENYIYWPPLYSLDDIEEQIGDELAGYAIKKLQANGHLNLEDDVTKLSDSKVLDHLGMGMNKQAKHFGIAVWYQERIAFGLILPKVPGWEKGHLVTMSEDKQNIFMDSGALVEKNWFKV